MGTVVWRRVGERGRVTMATVGGYFLTTTLKNGKHEWIVRPADGDPIAVGREDTKRAAQIAAEERVGARS